MALAVTWTYFIREVEKKQLRWASSSLIGIILKQYNDAEREAIANKL